MTKLGWSLNEVEHFVGCNEGRTEATRLDEIDEGKSQSSTTQRHNGNDTVFGAGADARQRGRWACYGKSCFIIAAVLRSTKRIEASVHPTALSFTDGQT